MKIKKGFSPIMNGENPIGYEILRFLYSIILSSWHRATAAMR